MTMTMMDKQGVYKITNKMNGKAYYGSASISFSKRWGQHSSTLDNNKHENNHLQNACSKYGKDALEFIIILVCAPEDCIYYEQLFLDKYFDGCSQCYNSSPMAGSCRGVKHSTETRANMSKAKKGKKQPPEQVAKRVLANTGKKRTAEVKLKMSAAHKGKKKSSETRAKMSAAKLGKSLSAVQREKLSKSNLNRIVTPETRAKISDAQKGEKGHMYGKHISAETKEKMRIANTGKKHTTENREKMKMNALGEKNSQAKLIQVQIREIRLFYANKAYTIPQLAQIYGVSKATIYDIITQRTWKGF